MLLTSSSLVDGGLRKVLCGTMKYDVSTQICCHNRLYDRKSPNDACCGWTPFNPTTHICCFNNVLDRKRDPFCVEFFHP
ncbi:hypothetical protein NP493_1395g00047 [Ridgeia piscesae]|uniref:Galaxin-like repeats domain-containing protein n=1 Tax=Ridgeia piscesae TaxID=27915 RepID=A0AAD9K4E6_RIDPI|nr:hypothetical protein NP493_1395g00047 [Ridgeia piscesae]